MVATTKYDKQDVFTLFHVHCYLFSAEHRHRLAMTELNEKDKFCIGIILSLDK